MPLGDHPRVDEAAIQEALEALRYNPIVRTIHECARRLGVPHSLAALLWEREEDLAMEMAYDRWANVRDAAACPDCHTSEEDWFDPETGRDLEWTPYKIELHSCRTCQEIKRLNDQDSEDRERYGVYWKLALRDWLDDKVDNGHPKD